MTYLDQTKLGNMALLSTSDLKQLIEAHVHVWDRSIAWNTKNIIKELVRRLPACESDE